MLIDLVDGFRSLLLPSRCAGCQVPVGPGDPPVCRSCLQGLPWAWPPFPAGWGGLVISPFRYEGLVRDLILAFKYQGRLSIAPFLAGRMAQAVTDRLGPDPADGIVPVPLHPTRLRERGFNQAQILARNLGDQLHLPVLSRLLERLRPTPPQAELSRAERQSNMRGAFELARNAPTPQNCRLLLVDDVFTTGATAQACTRVLKRAGATKVVIATIAQG